jgi:hypothetical protein
MIQANDPNLANEKRNKPKPPCCVQNELREKKSMMRESSLGTDSKKRTKTQILWYPAEPEPSFPEVLFPTPKKKRAGPFVNQP